MTSYAWDNRYYRAQKIFRRKSAKYLPEQQYYSKLIQYCEHIWSIKGTNNRANLNPLCLHVVASMNGPILHQYWYHIVHGRNFLQYLAFFRLVLISKRKQNYIKYCPHSVIKFGTVLISATLSNFDTVLISNIWSFKGIITVANIFSNINTWPNFNMVPKHEQN